MSEERQSNLSSFQREKRTWCGDYMIVNIYPRSRKQEQYAKSGQRKRATEVSRPAQRNLNDKNSYKHFKLLANGNFKEGDYFIRLSYSNKNLPKTLKQAKKDVSNYIERLKYELKKQGKEKDLKWMCVTEFKETNAEGKETRIHHHLIINNVLSRDLLEEKWSKRVKGKKKPQRIGFTDSKRIQETEDAGLDNLVSYLFKFNKAFRHWTASRNLERPKEKTTDHKYRRSVMEKLRYSSDSGQEYFEKKYPKYFVKDIIWFDFNYQGFTWSQCSMRLIKRDGG